MANSKMFGRSVTRFKYFKNEEEKKNGKIVIELYGEIIIKFIYRSIK